MSQAPIYDLDEPQEEESRMNSLKNKCKESPFVPIGAYQLLNHCVQKKLQIVKFYVSRFRLAMTLLGDFRYIR